MTIGTLAPHPAPLTEDRDGVIRVGRTRVQLASVIIAFNHGRTAEEILLMYPSLDLTDIYAVIVYYLWHRAEIDKYLLEHEKLEAASRGELERDFPSAGVRE